MAKAPNPAPAQRLTLITLAILALALVGFIVYRQFAPRQQTATAGAAANGTIDVDGQPLLGDKSAPVEIAVFEDFKPRVLGHRGLYLA